MTLIVIWEEGILSQIRFFEDSAMTLTEIQNRTDETIDHHWPYDSALFDAAGDIAQSVNANVQHVAFEPISWITAPGVTISTSPKLMEPR